MNHLNLPLLLTIPHSGEKIPEEASWLKPLDEVLLMRDVDRFVDRLYAQAIEQTELPVVVSEWHRYAGDLNRLPEDVDQDAVCGAASPPGSHTTGFLWVKTTQGETLIESPIAADTYQSLISKVFEPFHKQVKALYQEFKSRGFERVYHLDLHSMPSMGTAAHRDPGQKRAEVVISDQDGASCDPKFTHLVVDAFKNQRFDVATNWPYKGGRLTQTYGQPQLGQHCLQIELNRALYMNEQTKQLLQEPAARLQAKLCLVLSEIKTKIAGLP